MKIILKRKEKKKKHAHCTSPWDRGARRACCPWVSTHRGRPHGTPPLWPGTRGTRRGASPTATAHLTPRRALGTERASKNAAAARRQAAVPAGGSCAAPPSTGAERCCSSRAARKADPGSRTTQQPLPPRTLTTNAAPTPTPTPTTTLTTTRRIRQTCPRVAVADRRHRAARAPSARHRFRADRANAHPGRHRRYR
jgi:hypothetical protein